MTSVRLIGAPARWVGPQDTIDEEGEMGMRFGGTEVRPLGGAAGCLAMVVVSILVSVLLTVVLNVVLR